MAFTPKKRFGDISAKFYEDPMKNEAEKRASQSWKISIEGVNVFDQPLCPEYRQKSKKIVR